MDQDKENPTCPVTGNNLGCLIIVSNTGWSSSLRF